MNHPTRAILGGFMGNLVEAYDISLCYFLSRALATSLLGDVQGTPTVVLLLIFIAYLAKPLGAFFLGLLSDLYGRKKVLLGSIVVMGITTASIGLIPGFASIGLIASLLFLSLRVIQSMALGSEFLNSASFLVESGREGTKGFRGCWPSVGVKAGYLLACIITELNQTYLVNQGLDWAWRIPFLLAILTTLIGIYVRYRMPESLAYVLYYAHHAKPTTRSIYEQAVRFTKQYPFLFQYAFFASFLSVATGFFYYLYIPMHATQYSGLSHAFIMRSTMYSLVCVTFLIPLFGWVSDRCDRLVLLNRASLGLLLLSYPFMWAINYGDEAVFLSMQLLISVPCACYYSVSSVILTELFPLPIRCTALSITFSIAASLASGVPPLLSDFLAKNTGHPNSPSLIMIGLALIVLRNIRKLRETYQVGINRYATLTTKEGGLLEEISQPTYARGDGHTTAQTS